LLSKILFFLITLFLGIKILKMGGKMINTKSLLILFSIFSIVTLSPEFSKAAVNVETDDFENVEVGSIQQVSANISNPNVDKAVALSGISFSSDSCNDFSMVVSFSIPTYLQPGESVNVEIIYSPSFVGECSATLEISTDSLFFPTDKVTFTGTGVEQQSEQSDPNNISQLLLEKLQKIIDYTNDSYIYHVFRSTEQDSLGERRFKAFKKKLVVSYHLIESDQFEAAHNKLNEIYKKADGKPESNDFVPPEKAANLALMLQDLIASFDFEDKQAKQSKKAYK
jgi:hypothetical protein